VIASVDGIGRLAGATGSPGALASVGGEAVHQLSTNELAQHNHTATPSDIGSGHLHAMTVNEGSHSHTVSDTGHQHGFSGFNHSHGINQDSHTHTWIAYDQHDHQYSAPTIMVNATIVQSGGVLVAVPAPVTSQTTGFNAVSVNATLSIATSGISTQITTGLHTVDSGTASFASGITGSTGTGFTAQNTNLTGVASSLTVGIGNTGISASHNNVQPTMVLQHMIFLGRA
jgi:hypothetical protein